MYHIFFIYSCVNEHLGCFHVLAINNHAETKIEWGKEGRSWERGYVYTYSCRKFGFYQMEMTSYLDVKIHLPFASTNLCLILETCMVPALVSNSSDSRGQRSFIIHLIYRCLVLLETYFATVDSGGKKNRY